MAQTQNSNHDIICHFHNGMGVLRRVTFLPSRLLDVRVKPRLHDAWKIYENFSISSFFARVIDVHVRSIHCKMLVGLNGNVYFSLVACGICWKKA